MGVWYICAPAFSVPDLKKLEQTRRSQSFGQEFYKLQNIDAENDDVVRPWLQGFVDSVGQETAQQLTRGVGVMEQTASR